MTWFGFDEWRGDRVRSRLCVRQFKVEEFRDDLFAGTPDTFFNHVFVGQGCDLQGFRIIRCRH